MLTFSKFYKKLIKVLSLTNFKHDLFVGKIFKDISQEFISVITRTLLHFNGSDGATSTTDETDRHSYSFNQDGGSGSVEIDTAQSKFSSLSSLLVDNPSTFDENYIYTTENLSDFQVLNFIDYTIDFHIKFNIDPDARLAGILNLLDSSAPNDKNIELAHSGHATLSQFNFQQDFGSEIFSFTTPAGSGITDQDWHHVVFVKIGSKFAFYLDGNQIGYTTSSDSGPVADVNQFRIGRAERNHRSFSGWIEELRMINSNVFNANPVSGLTDTITVPTQEYSL